MRYPIFKPGPGILPLIIILFILFLPVFSFSQDDVLGTREILINTYQEFQHTPATQPSFYENDVKKPGKTPFYDSANVSHPNLKVQQITNECIEDALTPSGIVESQAHGELTLKDSVSTIDFPAGTWTTGLGLPVGGLTYITQKFKAMSNGYLKKMRFYMRRHPGISTGPGLWVSIHRSVNLSDPEDMRCAGNPIGWGYISDSVFGTTPGPNDGTGAYIQVEVEFTHNVPKLDKDSYYYVKISTIPPDLPSTEAFKQQKFANVTLSNPKRITCDKTGNIYVSDSGNNRIAKFNESLVLQGYIGVGNLNDPRGLVVYNDGRIYVASAGDSSVKIFNSAGTHIGTLSQWKRKLSETPLTYVTENFSQPDGIYLHVSKVTDKVKGYLFVSDKGRNKIYKFYCEDMSVLETVATTPDKWIGADRFGGAGSGNGQFNGPEDIDIDAQGVIAILDKGNLRVSFLSWEGDFIKNVSLSTISPSPAGICATLAGEVFIAERSGNKIVSIDRNGNQTRELTSSVLENDYKLSSPADVYVKNDGTVIVLNPGNGKIITYKDKFITSLSQRNLYDVRVTEPENVYSFATTGIDNFFGTYYQRGGKRESRKGDSFTSISNPSPNEVKFGDTRSSNSYLMGGTAAAPAERTAVPTNTAEVATSLWPAPSAWPNPRQWYVEVWGPIKRGGPRAGLNLKDGPFYTWPNDTMWNPPPTTHTKGFNYEFYIPGIQPPSETYYYQTISNIQIARDFENYYESMPPNGEFYWCEKLNGKYSYSRETLYSFKKWNYIPPALSHLRVTGVSTMTAGTASNITITAYDAAGNIYTTYTGVKQITFSGPNQAPNGTKPKVKNNVGVLVDVGVATALSFVNGQCTTTLTPYMAEAVSLDAADIPGGLNSYSNPAYDLDIIVNPGPAANLKITGVSPFTVAVAGQITVSAYDAYDNIATSWTGDKDVVFSGPSISPSGKNPTVKNKLGVHVAMGNPTTLTFSNGTVTTDMILYAIESTSVDAASGGINSYGSPAYDFDVTVNPGTISYLKVTPATLSAVAGTLQSVTVTAYDPGGNTVTSYTGDKQITFSGPQVAPDSSYKPQVKDKTGSFVNIGSPATLTFSNGAVTTQAVFYKAETTTLDASDGTYNSFGDPAYDMDLTVSPASVDRLKITGPNSMTAGVQSDITITAYDLYDNTATAYTGAKTLKFSGASPSPNGFKARVQNSSGVWIDFGAATVINFSLGAATRPMVLYKAEDISVDVETDVSVNPGSHGNSSWDLDVSCSAAAASYLTVTGAANWTAGQSQTITITAKDTFGNTATTYTGIKNLIFSGANQSPDGTKPTVQNSSGTPIPFGSVTSVNFTGGVAGRFMTLYRAESGSVDVSDTIDSHGSSSYDLDFTCNALTIDRYEVTEPSYIRTEGSPAFSVSIFAKDLYGNSTAGGWVSLSAHRDDSGSNPAPGVLTGTTFGIDCSSGSATVNNLGYSTVGKFKIQASDGSKKSILSATSPQINSWSYGKDWLEKTAGGTNTTFTARREHASVVFNSGGNKMWLIGGYEAGGSMECGEVWSSTDGTNWTRVRATLDANGFGRRAMLGASVLKTNIVITGGVDSSGASQTGVYYSNNGSTWTSGPALPSARHAHVQLTWNNRVWVIGGARHNASPKAQQRVFSWTGPPSITWTDVNPSLTYGRRYGHAGVVHTFDPAGTPGYGTYMVISGGYNDQTGTHYNDVWVCNDDAGNGATWTQITASAPWSARAFHQMLVYDEKLWVLGGADQSNTNYKTDVWFSTDGQYWTQAVNGAPFKAVNRFTALVFDEDGDGISRMWILMGRDPASQCLNRVMMSD